MKVVLLVGRGLLKVSKNGSQAKFRVLLQRQRRHSYRSALAVSRVSTRIYDRVDVRHDE